LPSNEFPVKYDLKLCIYMILGEESHLCGGGLEYLHLSPESRKRQQTAKQSQMTQ
jgi:hypothetical protein